MIGRPLGAWAVVVAGLFLALADRVCAQEPPTAVATEPAQATPERPGLFRVGSWYLTPYLHLGSLGIDTNVYYTAVDRQADFSASGGPGLEIVRPFGTKSRLRLDGGLNYLFFARTESQRRLNGYGSALLDLEGVKTTFVAQEQYVGSFSRPNPQVDARVQQTTEGTTAFLKRRLGERWSLALLGSRLLTTTDDQQYRGTNLGETLTENQYQAGGELRLALTVKTSLVGGGGQFWYRFPRLPERDGESTLAYGGFRTDETALVSGQALGGVRWFRPDSGAGAPQNFPYANVDATWNISPKTKAGGSYLRDFNYTSFATSVGAPTLVTETLAVFFDKTLVGNVYLRLFANQSRYVSVGEVTIVGPDGQVLQAKQDDRVRNVGAVLGYQFRPRVRVGVTTTYSTRRSTIATFGVQGLIAGLTVQYNPPQPSFK